MVTTTCLWVAVEKNYNFHKCSNTDYYFHKTEQNKSLFYKKHTQRMVINKKIAWKRSANKRFDLPQKRHNYVFLWRGFQGACSNIPTKGWTQNKWIFESLLIHISNCPQTVVRGCINVVVWIWLHSCVFYTSPKLHTQLILLLLPITKRGHTYKQRETITNKGTQL